jgi:integrase
MVQGQAKPTGPGRLRRVRLGIDGVETVALLTPAEEAHLRLRLVPFVAAARRIEGATEIDLAGQLRTARLHSLLRLPVDPAGAEEFTDEFRRLLERTAEVYARSIGDGTADTYRRRWASFSEWCSRRAVEPLPASAELVMLYLSDMIGREPPPALGTLRGHVTAINKVHLEADLPSPGSDPLLSMMMRGLARTVAPVPRRPVISALRIADLRDVCRSLSHPDPVVVRDCALLNLAAAGLNAGQLARLRWSDVRFGKREAVMALRGAWQKQPDTSFRLPRTANGAACPVDALKRWRELGGAVPDHIFTGVDRHGRRHTRMLSRSQLQAVIDGRLDALGRLQGSEPKPSDILHLLDTTSNDVLRDRALILLGFAGAFRRGEVTRLVWSDIQVVEEGLIVRLRQSKMDRLHKGTDVGIPRGRSLLTCPVRAVLAWKERMQDQLASDFSPDTCCWPKVGRSGRLDVAHPISPEGLTMVVKRRAEAAGVQGHWGGRSLRAGFITTAADLDIPLEIIATQSRQRSLDTVVRYVRTDDLFRRNAADRIGL